MPLFNNKRKDFSIQPPKQSIANGAFSVLDSANIDFTYASDILSANLTQTGVTASTYGDATNVPQFTVDIWGRITGVTLVPITGGGTYTVNNGLTENPSGNFRLGGALIQTTVITSTGFPLNIISNVSSNALSVINNSAVLGTIGVRGEGYYGIFGSGTQAGVRGISVNSIGVMGLSTNGVGGTFESTNAWGLEARSDAIGMEGAKISNNSSVNTAIEKVLRLTKQAPAPANGVGASLEYYISSSLIATYFSNSISSIWTDVTHASRTSQLEIRGVNNAVTARLLALTGPGQLILDKYGIGTFTGTPTYILGVDASGNVVETTGGGGGTITLSPIGSSPNANAATITGTVLNLEPASASFGGVVTTGTQTFAGAKTFQDQLTIDDGLVLSQNSNGVSGTNADIPVHPKTNLRLTNGGLVSLASISISAVVTGHQLWLHNDTGNSIIIVNNYGSSPVGSKPILTSIGTDIKIPNQGSIILEYDSTDSAWRLVGNPSPLTTKGDINTFSTINTRLAVGTNGFFLQANSVTTTGLEWTDTLANGAKATTQSPGDNSTLIATDAFVTQAVSRPLVASNLFNYYNFI